MSSLRSRIVLLLLLVLASPSAAWADVFKLAEFDFAPLAAENEYRLTARIPALLATRQPIVLPEACRQADLTVQPVGKEMLHDYRIRCTAPLGVGDEIGVPWPLDGAILTGRGPDGAFRRAVQPSGGVIALPVGMGAAEARPFLTVAGDYLYKGVVHILIGWDHLAFVLCLCILARGRSLLLLVTAFTVGHSLTLALAFLEVIRVPIPPVEASIAFSIVFMAREALRQEQPSRQASLRRAAIVVAFGLLHGLGFASVLDELGVARGERIPGLIFFNLGVEVGQLIFVGCVALVLLAARAVSLAPAVRTASILIAGVLGSFWTIERVVSFF